MSSGILRAGKYASKAALAQPLLPKIGEGSKPTDEASASGDSSVPSVISDGRILPEKMTTKDIVSTVAIGALSAAGLAASAAAMIAFPGPAVFVMGGICVANAPVVAKKHLSIAKSAGVRTSIHMIQEEVNLLKTEVDFLEQAVNDLEAEANVLAGVEENLQRIAREQGTNVDALVNLVNENEEILSRMKFNLKETFVAAIANIIIKSDTDGDMKIDLKELPLLSIRLQLQLDTYGIKLDTAMFEAMVKEDNDITNVLKFCGEVLFPQDEKNKEAAAVDDDHSVDSELTFDFESFCKGLDEDNTQKMSTEEKLGMVTIDNKYSKGSVEVARGKRMTLHQNNSKKDVRRKSIMTEVKRRQTKVAKASSKKALKPTKEARQTRLTLGGLVLIRGTSAEV